LPLLVGEYVDFSYRGPLARYCAAMIILPWTSLPFNRSPTILDLHLPLAQL